MERDKASSAHQVALIVASGPLIVPIWRLSLGFRVTQLCCRTVNHYLMVGTRGEWPVSIWDTGWRKALPQEYQVY